MQRLCRVHRCEPRHTCNVLRGRGQHLPHARHLQRGGPASRLSTRSYAHVRVARYVLHSFECGEGSQNPDLHAVVVSTRPRVVTWASRVKRVAAVKKVHKQPQRTYAVAPRTAVGDAGPVCSRTRAPANNGSAGTSSKEVRSDPGCGCGHLGGKLPTHPLLVNVVCRSGSGSRVVLAGRGRLPVGNQHAQHGLQCRPRRTPSLLTVPQRWHKAATCLATVAGVGALCHAGVRMGGDDAIRSSRSLARSCIRCPLSVP